MRNDHLASPLMALCLAVSVLGGCSASGDTRSSSPAPALTPAPTPTPTTASIDVLPCLDQTIPLDRVPPGTRVVDLVVPDTVTIWPDRPIGFPNGRLLSDPVIDITLGVVLLDINAAGQNAASFAAIPLNPPEATKPPLAQFPFANTPNDNAVLDPGTGTNFTFDSAPMSAYVIVERAGMPAVSTALILGPRKNAFNEGNAQLDTANTYTFDLIEGLRRFAEPLQDDLAVRGLKTCAARRVS